MIAHAEPPLGALFSRESETHARHWIHVLPTHDNDHSAARVVIHPLIKAHVKHA